MQQLSKERGLLGALCPGQKRLDGKSFYLDSVKSRSAALLVEAISLLGGRVESFLHKDVSFVVTGSQEGLKELSCVPKKAGAKGVKEETHCPTKQPESFLSSTDKQRPGAPRPTQACGSRGKALLEKAIRNKEQLQASSVLANARSWGVKILYVDDVLLYLKQFTRESFSAKHKRTERPYSKHQASPVVKASALRSPYLKVEDASRKYKPLHMQSVTFPALCYSSQFSPFESPPPLEKLTEQEDKTREKNQAANSIQDKSQTTLSCNPSPWRPRRKNLGYCECCHQSFTNLEEHLQSDQHRQFVLDSSSYSVIDQLVTEMFQGSMLDPSREGLLKRSPTHTPIQDTSLCELEPLSDTETEHAVQALRIQGSSFNTQVPSPTLNLLSSGPASPSPGIQFPSPNPAIPLADNQPFTPNAGCQFPDSQPSALSSALSLLDAGSLTPRSTIQQPDTQYLSPHPDTQCHSADPYDLPPVLSPQLPDLFLDPHSPYSEPPVLSPQQYLPEETMEGQTFEWETVEIVSQSVSAVTVPISTPFIPHISEISTECEKEESKQQAHLLGFRGLVCCNSDWECPELATRRSHSLPWLSNTTPNPKKRCRSTSPEQNPNKRRKTSMTFGCSTCWTGQGHKSFAKPQNETMPMSEGCLLFEVSSKNGICSHTDFISTLSNASIPNKTIQVFPTSSTCLRETLSLSEPPLIPFSVSPVRNFNDMPDQSDALCVDSGTVTDEPTWPSPKARISPFLFPNGKPCGAFSSQDSQPSLSHSISSVCIESALIPDVAALSPSSSESDWDCELMSRLCSTQATPPSTTEQSCELDKEILQKPCTWMHNTSYESHLHHVLQPPTSTTSLCGEEIDSSAFSRTVVQIVEVQH
ncbi:hypothetical protein LDENG_00152160 [Lucifuga dentata]|nr:hypothetical protein LDENG_00152160 [Lucifuga dentata]